MSTFQVTLLKGVNYDSLNRLKHSIQQVLLLLLAPFYGYYT